MTLVRGLAAYGLQDLSLNVIFLLAILKLC